MREFEVVLYGATGFTGRLVAQYLAKTYPAEGANSLRWALAGRNEQKLKQLQQALHLEHVPVLVADSQDAEELAALVARTAVVASTVGPYASYGEPLVSACASVGTHYCDLTGEVQWMRRMIDRHSAAAQASGARIVHTCGFDSIPSDLGTLFVHNAMHARTGDGCAYVKFRAAEFKGGFSGGTIASMLQMLAEAEAQPSLRDLLANPYALNPAGTGGLDGPDRGVPEFDTDFASYVAPFVMASINTRVVRRTNALLDWRYGRSFRYDEGMLMGAGPAGFAKALALAAGSGVGQATLRLPGMRKLLERVLPKPGTGPSQAQREAGFYRIEFFARSASQPDTVVRATVAGDRDPGYGSTAKMLGESAVCLARDDSAVAGGFWTPASAMGERLIERLQERAGLTFELNN